MDAKQYLDFIRDTLRNEGIRVADTANKMALDAKMITTDQYLSAARLIVSAYLDQQEDVVI